MPDTERQHLLLELGQVPHLAEDLLQLPVVIETLFARLREIRLDVGSREPPER